MNIKKCLSAVAAIAAITTAAQAELTTHEITQVINWAEARGYFYEGTEKAGRFEANCFTFSNRKPGPDYLCAYAPVSSDTADEAINALIASAVTFDELVSDARKAVVEARRETAPSARMVHKAPRQRAGIPPDVLERIKANAENEWPDDYEMQEFVIKNQVDAYSKLNN